MPIRLIKSFTFEAAHFLPSFPEGHKCRNMHGHSFRAEIIVAGDLPEEQGYLIDYGDIAKILEPLRLTLDHHLLNDIDGLENPTSEMIAKWLWDRIHPQLPLLDEVRIHETCTSRCEYQGES